MTQTDTCGLTFGKRCPSFIIIVIVGHLLQPGFLARNCMTSYICKTDWGGGRGNEPKKLKFMDTPMLILTAHLF